MIAIFVYLGISLFFGGLLCFRGEKLILPILQIMVLLCALTVCITRFGASVRGILIAVAASILLWVLFHFFYKLVFFTLGAMGGAMLGALLSGFLPGSLTGYAWILTLILALAVGICCAVCRKSFVMLATAYSGATLMVAPICFLLREWGKWGSFVYADGALATMLQLNRYLTTELLAQQTLPMLLGAVILTAVGFVCQKKSDLA